VKKGGRQQIFIGIPGLKEGENCSLSFSSERTKKSAQSYSLNFLLCFVLYMKFTKVKMPQNGGSENDEPSAVVMASL
jgi:hypothetical protein